jgi:hypothetical protein
MSKLTLPNLKTFIHKVTFKRVKGLATDLKKIFTNNSISSTVTIYSIYQ